MYLNLAITYNQVTFQVSSRYPKQKTPNLAEKWDFIFPS
jgi:hypothetical protein